jgi:hypothetical protein
MCTGTLRRRSIDQVKRSSKARPSGRRSPTHRSLRRGPQRRRSVCGPTHVAIGRAWRAWVNRLWPVPSSTACESTVPTTCHGASATVSFVLSCPDRESAANGSVQSVKSGRWHGRLGVVLETKLGPNADQRVTYRLYLDPKTWLPFARTSTAITNTSDHVRADSSGPINSTFVKTASLPKSLFTTASIDRWVSSHAT